MAEKKDSANQKSQRGRFIQAARELGCDEDEGRFDEKLKRVARSKSAAAKKEKPASGSA
jgi:hypothetical protein